MDYNAIDAVNASTLKVLYQKSPLHYRYALTHQRTETPAMALGTAVHMAVLEPERFALTYTVRPAWVDARTKEGKAWIADHAGVAVLTEDAHETILAMAQSVVSNEAARRYVVGGDPERVLIWTDAETGINCKGRCDLVLADGTLTDLKTAKDISPRGFARAAADFGYAFSMAFYHDGLIANGITPPEVVMVAVESAAPHDVAVYRICEDDIDVGREMYRTALTRLAKCRASGRWPGRFDTVQELCLPAWAYPEEKPETLKGWDGLERETIGGDDE
jgi:exodeoxyribonuclease VIII